MQTVNLPARSPGQPGSRFIPGNLQSARDRSHQLLLKSWEKDPFLAAIAPFHLAFRGRRAIEKARLLSLQDLQLIQPLRVNTRVLSVKSVLLPDRRRKD